MLILGNGRITMFRSLPLGSIKAATSRKSTGCMLARKFHASHQNLSEINPIYPDESFLVKVKKPGQLLAEPIDPNYRLGYSPLYTGPLNQQIAFTKRWSMGIMFVGGYIAHLAFDAAGFSSLTSTLGLLPFIIPVPLIQYYTAPYVTRIFRVYNKNEPQTLENLTKDETIVLEKVGLFGRKTYATQVELQDLKLVNQRHGWVNWQYQNEKGIKANFYVVDNIGGLKMDRIWGIIEQNSGKDSARSFLNEIDETKEE